MHQKLFQFFLPQEAGNFGNSIKKEPQNSLSKLKKYVYYTFKKNYCSACNPVQVIVFYKNVLILQNNNSNFITLRVA